MKLSQFMVNPKKEQDPLHKNYNKSTSVAKKMDIWEPFTKLNKKKKKKKTKKNQKKQDTH
jgi:hypothetical protein